MSRQGRAGVALLLSALGSFIGGGIGILIMMLFSPIIVDVALSFGPPEYFAMMALGLIAASTVSTGSPLKGMAMVVFGVALGMIGTDIETGMPRFAFHVTDLYDGISLVPIAMGLFGVSEVSASIKAIRSGKVTNKITFRSMVPTRDDMRRFWFPVLRGAALGSFFGALPGTGGVIASFAAYALEKKVSKEPERFGRGAIEGVIAPETANNAADQTAFIPTMTLGIPGSVVMALMIGALMIHGISPGPQIMVKHPDLFWGLIMSFWIGNVLLLVLNLPLIGIWIRVLLIPYHLLYPAVLMFVCMGVYSINNSTFDVALVIVFGVAGYVMRLLDLQPAPLLLGFVLGPMMEDNLRRTLIISRGEFTIFLERPISAVLVISMFVLLAWVLWQSLPRRPRSFIEQAP
jgi:TctA family transporter